MGEEDAIQAPSIGVLARLAGAGHDDEQELYVSEFHVLCTLELMSFLLHHDSDMLSDIPRAGTDLLLLKYFGIDCRPRVLRPACPLRGHAYHTAVNNGSPYAQ